MPHRLKMVCKCGGMYVFINERRLVDSSEFEYLCGTCTSRFLLYKEPKGEYRWKTTYGEKGKWNTKNSSLTK